MAIIFIPDEILEKLRNGDLLFTDLENFEVGLPEINEQPKIFYQKQPIDLELKWKVLERDNFTCKNCGSRRFLQADHIKPESKGGEATLENLQTLCKRCNVKKGSKFNENTN